MKNIRRLLSIVVCSCMLLTSCGTSEETTATVSQNAEVVIDVLYQNTITDTIVEETTYIGRIQPDETVSVIPKLAGEVLIANYSVGDYVTEGALLLKIDDSDIISSINVAQKGYDASVQSVSQSEGSMLSQAISVDSQVEAAQTAYDNAVKSLENFETNNPLDDVQDTLNDLYQSKRDLELQNTLLSELVDETPNGTTRDTYIAEININNAQLYQIELSISAVRTELSDASNSIESSRISIQSQVDSAKVQLDSALKSQEMFHSTTVSDTSNVLSAQLNQAQAQLEQSQSQLKNATVTSPVSGVILEKNINVNDMASQQSAAYVISNNNTAVSFGVTQTVAQTLSIGDYVTIEEGREVYQAKVVEIATSIDNNSGLFNVKALVDLQGRTLLTGVAVKVTAITDKAEEIPTVPIYSLYYDNQDPYVYTIDSNNKAKKTYITIGLLGEDTVEVLSGLEETDKIITSWDANLLEGVSVVGEFDGSTFTNSSTTDEELETEETEETEVDTENEEESTDAD